MGQPNYKNGFRLTLHKRALDLPLAWHKPQIVFVNSMSDLFHKDVPVEFIRQTFETMRAASQHTFQVLTKRSDRLLELDKTIEWAPNIWMGVSIENETYGFRINDLRKTHAQIKFLSLEPLLGPLPRLNLKGIDWVIVGGESGPGARPIEEEWITDIRDQCRKARVPFFFKQWGGFNKKRNGRLLQGRTWAQMPKRMKIARAR
jgi:protein gp37